MCGTGTGMSILKMSSWVRPGDWWVDILTLYDSKKEFGIILWRITITPARHTLNYKVLTNLTNVFFIDSTFKRLELAWRLLLIDFIRPLAYMILHKIPAFCLPMNFVPSFNVFICSNFQGIYIITVALRESDTIRKPKHCYHICHISCWIPFWLRVLNIFLILTCQKSLKSCRDVTTLKNCGTPSSRNVMFFDQWQQSLYFLKFFKIYLLTD